MPTTRGRSTPTAAARAAAATARAYLHHVFKAGEIIAAMLLTWHNLHYYQELMAGAARGDRGGRAGGVRRPASRRSGPRATWSRPAFRTARCLRTRETRGIIERSPNSRGCTMKDRDGTADIRLAAYGTLAPGRVNHHHLAGMEGTWRKGKVKRSAHPRRVGCFNGRSRTDARPVGRNRRCGSLQSADLPRHWLRLDAFEGEGYRRLVTRVSTPEGELDAWIYVLAAELGSRPIE